MGFYGGLLWDFYLKFIGLKRMDKRVESKNQQPTSWSDRSQFNWFQTLFQNLS
jgi:hypothetical protein